MPSRKPYAIGIARREQILRAARELFSVRGYRGASMRDVAAEVELTLAGVLHYFPTKEDLLAEVLQHRTDVDVPWFYATWEELGSFRLALRELMVRNMAEPGVMRLFTTLSAEATDPAHPAHDFFVKRYRTSRELFDEAVTKAREAGEVTRPVAGPALVAVLDGLQIQWLIEPDFDLLAALESYLDSITG
ncbi:helix-turn-helix domain-containing protein [Nonomuraea sp. NPDC050310]|uniref:TetR/AcrR family transcriptional regulator n=1 Tax=unclassified Nonomuraea TaxID=2593643 RepID=UPI0033C09754